MNANSMAYMFSPYGRRENDGLIDNKATEIIIPVLTRISLLDDPTEREAHIQKFARIAVGVGHAEEVASELAHTIINVRTIIALMFYGNGLQDGGERAWAALADYGMRPKAEIEYSVENLHTLEDVKMSVGRAFVDITKANDKLTKTKRRMSKGRRRESSYQRERRMRALQLIDEKLVVLDTRRCEIYELFREYRFCYKISSGAQKMLDSGADSDGEVLTETKRRLLADQLNEVDSRLIEIEKSLIALGALEGANHDPTP